MLTVKSLLHSVMSMFKHSWAAFCSMISLGSGVPGRLLFPPPSLRPRLGLAGLPDPDRPNWNTVGVKHTARLLAFICLGFGNDIFR